MFRIVSPASLCCLHVSRVGPDVKHMADSRVQMLHKIFALITHHSPKKAPNRYFLQFIVTRNRCLRTKLLMNVFPMKSMRASVWSARQKLALSAPSSCPHCQPHPHIAKMTGTCISMANFIFGRQECLLARFSISSSAISRSWMMIIVCPNIVIEFNGP